MSENNEKTKISRWIVIILVGLIIAAYGFIINSALGRITQTERDIKNLNPVLLQIQISLAKIQSDIEWLKQK